jgi:threonine dehydrogenase-like Zn-dependent dehydrogenase
MRQLSFIGDGRFEWRDVPLPQLHADTDALVRPLAVARCDLDLYIATGVVNYPGPFSFGHEMVGEVTDAGAAAGVTPGQRVVVPFQLSCGRCDNCRRGWTNSCSAYPFCAAFGLPTSGTDYGGALSDCVRVPFADHMLVPLPEGVDPVAAASACDNVADGWRGVAAPLRERPGASVLVVGGLAQSVGIYAAGAAVALGASRILYLDDDAERRRRAEKLGADVAPLMLGEGRKADARFEIVVEAAGTADALGFAVQSCAPNGVVTSVSMHFGATTPVPLTRAYYKGLTLHTGRVHSRAVLPDVLGCMACGKLHPEHVTHRVAAFGEAADAMADAGPKLVFVP